jgi:pimeloyl-ACP methyl ester carboxylesterase
MRPVLVRAFENSLRFRNRLVGVGRHRDPFRHFGPGGVAEAEALCEAAGRDFPAFIRPPETIVPAGVTIDARAGRLRFDSPLPSGHEANDRVVARLIPARTGRADGRTIVVHHALLQRRWGLWEWFAAPLAARFNVVIMAAPYHFERAPAGWFPGEGTVNPNPWRMYESMRQWSWDQKALTSALRETAGLDPVAVVGMSLGAFQTLLVAAAGDLAGIPLVSIAATNRYAYGLRHGVLGADTLDGLRRAGIDGSRLDRMVDAIQLERYVAVLRGRPILWVAGKHDRVDPPPSAARLEAALAPTRSVWLDAGHATLLLERKRIAREIYRFLEEEGIA